MLLRPLEAELWPVARFPRDARGGSLCLDSFPLSPAVRAFLPQQQQSEVFASSLSEVKERQILLLLLLDDEALAAAVDR